MSVSRAGLKQIVACDVGTLGTTQANATAIGLRNEGSMEISPFKEVRDYLGGRHPNMKNFKIEAESLQPTIKMLKNMISFLNYGCDLQVVTRPQTAGGSGDVYQFTGDNKPGLDFEYMVSADKRSLKAIWEIAMEYARAQTLIDAADSATAETFAGITGEGANFSAYRAPYFLAFEAPESLPVFQKDDITDRAYFIKTRSVKDIRNGSIVDYLEFEFKIKARDASVAKKVEIMSKNSSPSIYVREQNDLGGAFFDAFKIAPGVLTLSEVFENKDDDRTLEMVFTRGVPLSEFSWHFGAEGGAGVSGDGSKGGTLEVGYWPGPQCAQCKRYGAGVTYPQLCPAFNSSIPKDILDNDFIHLAPHPEQDNETYLFDPKDDFNENPSTFFWPRVHQ